MKYPVDHSGKIADSEDGEFSVVRFGPSVRQSHGGDYWTCLSQRYLDNILPATAHPELTVSLIMSRLCQVKKLLSSSWES